VPRRSRGRAAMAVVALVSVVAGLVAGQALGPSGHDGAPRAAVPGAAVAAKGGPGPSSEAVALDAGVRYAALMAELLPLDPAAAKAVVEEAASDAYRPALVAAVDAELVPLQRQIAALGSQPFYRQSVLAARLIAHAPPRAEVAAWVLVVAGQSAGDGTAVATFATITVWLAFERGAWRLDRSAELSGPSPQLGDPPSTVEALVSRLEGFEDWRPAR
jgi:hypothetical protein